MIEGPDREFAGEAGAIGLKGVAHAVQIEAARAASETLHALENQGNRNQHAHYYDAQGDQGFNQGESSGDHGELCDETRQILQRLEVPCEAQGTSVLLRVQSCARKPLCPPRLRFAREFERRSRSASWASRLRPGWPDRIVYFRLRNCPTRCIARPTAPAQGVTLMPHRLATWLLWIGIVFSIAPGVGHADELAASLGKLQFADGDTLVFLGDSITHQCLYTQYVEDYFYTRMPKVHIRFHNSGVGGDRAMDASESIQRDVAFYKPKYVTVLLGMNDGSYQPYDETVFQTYRRDMTKLVDQIQASGAKPILMTPTMYDARAKRMRDPKAPAEPTELYNATLAYYGAWLREQAVERGLGFVDMYSPLNNLTLESRETDPKFTMIRDAVHPDAPGQLVMAFALLSDLGVPRMVSNIMLSRAADDGVTSEVQPAGRSAMPIYERRPGVHVRRRRPAAGHSGRGPDRREADLARTSPEPRSDRGPRP